MKRLACLIVATVAACVHAQDHLASSRERLLGARPVAYADGTWYYHLPANDNRGDPVDPSWKLAPSITGGAVMGGERGTADTPSHYWVYLFEPDVWGRSRIEQWIRPKNLMLWANDPQVAYIEPVSKLTVDMDIVRQFSGDTYVDAVAGFEGAGVTGAVTDEGLKVTHVDFQSIKPIVRFGDTGGGWHGTSCYGIIFGDGTGEMKGRGLAPKAQGVFTAYTEVWDDDFAHMDAIVGLGCVFDSRSYGSAQTWDYNGDSRYRDHSLFWHDTILGLQSQSNTGTHDSRPQAWAKNVVSVGGVTHEDTLTKKDDHWTSASHGPAKDGRFKPELAAFFDNVWCPYGSYGGNDWYWNFGGTSAATPIIAGHYAIVCEMWQKGVFGLKKTKAPRGHTGKALLIAAAAGNPQGWSVDQVPREKQGFGMPNLRDLYRAGKAGSVTIIDSDHPLKQSEFDIEHVIVPPCAQRVVVVMSFLDPEALPQAEITRINKIGLTVAGTDRVKWHGNYGLWDHDASLPWGEIDDVNTVEVVVLDKPHHGGDVVWAQVMAREINLDAYPATDAEDAVFGLVMIAVPSRADINCDGRVDVSDASEFWDKYRAKDLLADVNGDSVLDTRDSVDFLAEFRRCMVRR